MSPTEHDAKAYLTQDDAIGVREILRRESLAQLQHGEFSAAAGLGPEGRAWLCWTDYVANDWAEEHASLALAIMRMGLLLDAVESGETFTCDATSFDEEVGHVMAGLTAP